MQINKSDFDIVTLEDEIRVDGLCKELVMAYYNSLLESGLNPAAATERANGADYFIRDFVVAVKQANLFAGHPALVRQFAGNWYIVNTLEPSIEHLAEILPGVADFSRFLAQHGLISAVYLGSIEKECADLLFYEARIESFWGITGDGYREWEQGCTLKEPLAPPGHG